MNPVRTILLLILFLLPVICLRAQGNIEFIENKGQWDNGVRYLGNVPAGAFYIQQKGYTVLQHDSTDWAKVTDIIHKHKVNSGSQNKTADVMVRSHAYKVEFLNGNQSPQLIADKALNTYNNYFIGNDPSKWASRCKIFQAVTMKDVYPNVDVRYYSGEGTLKYDIIVRPGADVSRIAMKYTGAEKLEIKNKELVVKTSVGNLRERSPFTYQAGAKGRNEVSCKYVVKGNVVTFDIKNYDRNSTLIIDPTLDFCSFAGSVADNYGFTATYGPDETMYGGGIVFGVGFPVSTGAFQVPFGGGSTSPTWPVDIGIIKLTSDGSNRDYATYIGGGGTDIPQSLVVDPQGNLIVAGRTNSGASYPTNGVGLIGSSTGSDFDIIITKLDAAGANMIGSKRIGGTGDDGANITAFANTAASLQRNYGDECRSEVILDGAGNIYLASCTKSTNFPLVSAFQTTNNLGIHNQDAVVLKMSPDVSTLLFSSYLGGSGNDAAYVLDINPSTGDLYVAGGTESADFPGNHAGTIGTATHGGIDGFVAQISGTTLVRSTYIGTNGIDQIFGIKFDRSGFPYVVGQTTGNWVPVNAAYSNTGAKQFIAKLQPNLSAFVYSTMFGTAASFPNISPTAFSVDRCENVYVSGWGGEVVDGYPSTGTTGMPVTPDAIKANSPDNKDFYFFVLKKDAASQLYGSFFGQDGGLADHVDGGTSRFDSRGVIYQAICANCGGGNFPTTTGAWSTVNPAQNNSKCNLAMVKMSFNLAGVGSDVGSAIGGVARDTAGCIPLDVTFTDEIRNAVEYIWNFGEGPDVGPLPAATGYTQTHTYNTVGTYRVMLIAIDPASCNVRDTSYINIRVGDLRANLAASYAKAPGNCQAFDYIFTNLSTTDISRPFTNTSFIWRFGDGSAPVVAGMNNVTHTYPGPGTYTARLILNDTAYCNNPDSITIDVRVAANVDALFTTPAVGCAPDTAVFTNISAGGQTFQWDFGDPGSGANNTSAAINPTHIYANPGTYNIVMVATDLNTCNITDTARFTLVVYDRPTSDFSFTPVTPVENTPNIFTNLASANSVRFKWLFGDGDSLVTTSRADVEHQYNATGTFNACLIAYNQAGCEDRMCRPVSTIVIPALDVPNAFTPNSGDVNSKIFVRGFGITKMRFIIWNRWGQKVFETGNRFQGWDGRVKGVVQPMDVYAYTLEVEFFDGKKASKKGDITLIR